MGDLDRYVFLNVWWYFIGVIGTAEREAVYREATSAGEQQTQPGDSASKNSTPHTTGAVRQGVLHIQTLHNTFVSSRCPGPV